MVNVNPLLPFNLHHKNLSSITNTMDRHASTSFDSHSASTSTSNRGRPPLFHTTFACINTGPRRQTTDGRPFQYPGGPGHESTCYWIPVVYYGISKYLGLCTRSRFGNVQGVCITAPRYPGATAAARRERPNTKRSGSGDTPSSPIAAGTSSSQSAQQLQ